MSAVSKMSASNHQAAILASLRPMYAVSQRRRGSQAISGKRSFPLQPSPYVALPRSEPSTTTSVSRGDPSFTQPCADGSQHDLIPSYLSKRVSSHCWSSRDNWVGGALPYLRAAPNCCCALTTGSLTPDLSTDSVMRACSDWYVRSTVQNLA